MTISCQQIKDQLPDLPPDPMDWPAGIGDHLAACPECRTDYEDMKAMRQLFADMPLTPPPPPDLTDRVLDAIDHDLPPDRTLSWLIATCLSLVATLAVLRIGAGFIWSIASHTSHWLWSGSTAWLSEFWVMLKAFSATWLDLIPGDGELNPVFFLWVALGALSWALYTAYQASKQHA